jgi:hypothetical protein
MQGKWNLWELAYLWACAQRIRAVPDANLSGWPSGLLTTEWNWAYGRPVAQPAVVFIP